MGLKFTSVINIDVHFCSTFTMQLKIALTFMLECPLYNSIKDEFPSLFQMRWWVVPNLSTNWIIKLVMLIISQRPLHSITLKKSAILTSTMIYF